MLSPRYSLQHLQTVYAGVRLPATAKLAMMVTSRGSHRAPWPTPAGTATMVQVRSPEARMTREGGGPDDQPGTGRDRPPRARADPGAREHHRPRERRGGPVQPRRPAGLAGG